MMTDKAVIMARGLGTRMRREDQQRQVVLSADQARAAERGLKAMMPIERPFLDYVLTQLADAGITKACLVIGPEHQQIRDYYQSIDTRRLQISFAEQAEPRGTADALAAAESFVGDSQFLCINGDNFYPREALLALQKMYGPGLIGFQKDALVALSNIPAERINRFGAVVADADSNLTRIIEKPDPATAASLGPDITISMNCWRFTPLIFQACRHIGPSPRGELELTDAVQYAVEHLEQQFRLLPMRLGVLDLTSRDDVGPVARRLRGTEVSL